MRADALLTGRAIAGWELVKGMGSAVDRVKGRQTGSECRCATERLVLAAVRAAVRILFSGFAELTVSP